ncbi:BTB/POZ domain-containing protein [Stagonosporopsis vannaccii]|nr:BTB/POZ domain-containing protein [Stagonosporopsis vannaccii]
MATTSQKLLLASFKDSMTSGAYSDLTITCGSDIYKVHKVVVCGRADFFARAVKFGGQESQTGEIHLPKDEPEVIKLLIRYLYEGEYEPTLSQDGDNGTLPIPAPPTPTPPRTPRIHKSQIYHLLFPHKCYLPHRSCTSPLVCPHHTCNYNSCGYTCSEFICKECQTPPLPQLNGTASQLLTHSKMYEIGERYEVIGLKDLAKEKFARACKHFWNTPDFAPAAHHAFSTTIEDDKGLRGIVSATICEHIELVNEPGVSVLMMQFNGLALEILQAKVKEHRWDEKD